MGIAIVKGAVFIEDFSRKNIKNPEIIKVANKVESIIESGMIEIQQKTGVFASRVKIKSGGKTYSSEVVIVREHPKNSISLEECINKFKKIIGFLIKSLRSGTVKRVISEVETMEEMRDVAELPLLLS